MSIFRSLFFIILFLATPALSHAASHSGSLAGSSSHGSYDFYQSDYAPFEPKRAVHDFSKLVVAIIEKDSKELIAFLEQLEGDIEERAALINTPWSDPVLVKEDDSGVYYPIHMAMLTNNHWIIERLIEAGASLDCPERPVVEMALIYVSITPETLEILLKYGAPDELDHRGWYAVHLAVCMKLVEKCSTLLRNERTRSRLAYIDQKGQSIAHYAVLSGTVECLELLLACPEARALIDWQACDGRGCNVYDAAIRLGNIEQLRVLEQYAIPWSGLQWRTPLEDAARLGRLEMVELLMKNSRELALCDIAKNTRQVEGGVVKFSPLIWASVGGDLYTIALLISKGFPLNFEVLGRGLNNAYSDQWYFTPLHYALVAGHSDVAMYYLARVNDTPCVSDEHLRINTVAPDGLTPLQYAALVGETRLISRLIERGADVMQEFEEPQVLFKRAAVSSKRARAPRIMVFDLFLQKHALRILEDGYDKEIIWLAEEFFMAGADLFNKVSVPGAHPEFTTLDWLVENNVHADVAKVARSSDGNTLLHLLALQPKNQEKLIKLAGALLARGADIFAKNHAGQTPLEMFHGDQNSKLKHYYADKIKDRLKKLKKKERAAAGPADAPVPEAPLPDGDSCYSDPDDFINLPLLDQSGE